MKGRPQDRLTATKLICSQHAKERLKMKFPGPFGIACRFATICPILSREIVYQLF